MDLDKVMPKLLPLELAVAINACREAGAVNAANALSKHISRLEIEIEQLKAKVKILSAG